MSLRVHIKNTNIEEQKELYFSSFDPEIRLSLGDEIPDPADYEILVNPHPTKDWLEASPDLRAVIVPWAGIPEKTRTIMAEYPDVDLHNLHHNNYNTAELGFGLLLAAAKFIIPLDQALRRNDWNPRYDKPRVMLLRDRTALILGFGEIGQALGEYCLGFGMKVLATKKHPDSYEGGLDVEIYSNDEMHALLEKADVLLIALPLTDETENLIGETELALMPEGSIVVNIGRGPIINQGALYKALTTGHLRAAASDVWYNYPASKESRDNTPPADFPFGELDNFVLSPHRAGLGDETDNQRVQALAELLNAANRGEAIPNKVDLKAGY